MITEDEKKNVNEKKIKDLNSEKNNLEIDIFNCTNSISFIERCSPNGKDEIFSWNDSYKWLNLLNNNFKDKYQKISKEIELLNSKK